MKVVVPWPVDAPELAPMPEGVERSRGSGRPSRASARRGVRRGAVLRGEAWTARRFTRMKVLQTESAGVGWILPYVPAGVTVCDASGPHDQSTAEWAVTAMLTSTRQMPWYVRQQDLSTWSPVTAHELAGGGFSSSGPGPSVGPWSACCPASASPSPGSPVLRATGCTLRGAAVAAACCRHRRASRTPDRPHGRHGRRSVPCRTARRCARRERIAWCSRRPGRAARRADLRSDQRGARRHHAGAAAADHPLWRAPACSSRPTSGVTRSRCTLGYGPSYGSRSSAMLRESRCSTSSRTATDP